MSNFWLVDCVNCGQQVEIGGPEDICYWCHKSASKKEDIMAENERTVETGAVPPKPKKRTKRDAYWEQNKEDIIGDYRSMPLREFLKRWSMATTTWINLKKLWGVPNKSKGIGSRPVKEATPKAPKQRKGEDTALTEHEELMMLRGYKMAVREFLRADKN